VVKSGFRVIEGGAGAGPLPEPGRDAPEPEADAELPPVELAPRTGYLYVVTDADPAAREHIRSAVARAITEIERPRASWVVQLLAGFGLGVLLVVALLVLLLMAA
jgi:hypothetical protein